MRLQMKVRIIGLREVIVSGSPNSSMGVARVVRLLLLLHLPLLPLILVHLPLVLLVLCTGVAL